MTAEGGGRTEMTGVEWIVAYGAYRAARFWIDSSAARRRVGPARETPRGKAPGKVVTLIGRTGAGKSSTANALLGRSAFRTGPEHGTTATVAEAEAPDGYRLRDTPGLLDEVDYSRLIWDALEDAALVVYATTGQLYRPELEILSRVSDGQRAWDAGSGTPGRRRLAVFVNHDDVRLRTMPHDVRRRETEALRAQVARWVPPEWIVSGSASPFGGRPDRPAEVDALRALIRSHFQLN
jgi:hypothetical protein